jgi:hypothetical protein
MVITSIIPTSLFSVRSRTTQLKVSCLLPSSGTSLSNLSSLNPFWLHAGILPQLEVAYETWGKLNPARDNAILLHTGLSASSHAASHGVSINTYCQWITPGHTHTALPMSTDGLHMATCLFAWGIPSYSGSYFAAQHAAWMVGALHWTRAGTGHQPFLCCVLQQLGRLLWHNVGATRSFCVLVLFLCYSGPSHINPDTDEVRH